MSNISSFLELCTFRYLGVRRNHFPSDIFEMEKALKCRNTQNDLIGNGSKHLILKTMVPIDPFVSWIRCWLGTQFFFFLLILFLLILFLLHILFLLFCRYLQFQIRSLFSSLSLSFSFSFSLFFFLFLFFFLSLSRLY